MISIALILLAFSDNSRASMTEIRIGSPARRECVIQFESENDPKYIYLESKKFVYEIEYNPSDEGSVSVNKLFKKNHKNIKAGTVILKTFRGGNVSVDENDWYSLFMDEFKFKISSAGHVEVFDARCRDFEFEVFDENNFDYYLNKLL